MWVSCRSPTPSRVSCGCRTLVSASNAAQLFDLRCDVREGMVAWLQRTNPGALPCRRIEHQTSTDRVDTYDGGYPDAPQADSGLFSGSADADRRGRAFEKTG